MADQDHQDDSVKEIQKAREYAYLGMYAEALSHYDKGMKSIQDRVNKTKADKMLQSEWKFVSKELNEEIVRCKKLHHIVSTGRSDFDDPMKELPDVDDRGRNCYNHRVACSKAKNSLQQTAVCSP